MITTKSRLRRSFGKASRIPRTYLDRMAIKLRQVDVIEDELYTKYNVKRGLRNANGTGVVVGLTKIGEVKGYKTDENDNKLSIEGELYYRGYEVKSLVRNYIAENRFGFEEVTYLLIFGELPTKTQLAEFKSMLAEKRELPYGFARDMILTAPSNSIMNKLARSVLALYCYDDNPEDTSIENVLRQSIDLIGYFPALIAYAYQAKQSFFENQSMHLHYPIPDLGTAENILRMLRPTGEFTDLEAKALDISLVLHAEHGGGNNSCFATHLLSSTLTDTYSAIAAAIGSLKGPRHGGANISVLRMIDDIKANVHDITNHREVDQHLLRILRKEAGDGSGLIYGMGHAIYTKSDPRAVVMKDMAKRLSAHKGLEDDYQLCDYIEERTPSLVAQFHGLDEVPMCANIDLYSGFVYSALNIPTDVSTPLFAMARLSGWCAHRLEELVSSSKLIRPAYINIQDHQEFVPIGDRKEPTRREISRETRSLNKAAMLEAQKH